MMNHEGYERKCFCPILTYYPTKCLVKTRDILVEQSSVWVKTWTGALRYQCVEHDYTSRFGLCSFKKTLFPKAVLLTAPKIQDRCCPYFSFSHITHRHSTSVSGPWVTGDCMLQCSASPQVRHQSVIIKAWWWKDQNQWNNKISVMVSNQAISPATV
jgi:hypothetical protein